MPHTPSPWQFTLVPARRQCKNLLLLWREDKMTDETQRFYLIYPNCQLILSQFSANEKPEDKIQGFLDEKPV